MQHQPVSATDPSILTPDGGAQKKKRRQSILLDMTPMVDMAFLLLTFFMLTTIYKEPTRLQLNLEDTPKPEPATGRTVEKDPESIEIVIRNDGSYMVNNMLATSADSVFNRLKKLSESGGQIILSPESSVNYGRVIELIDGLYLMKRTKVTVRPPQ